MIMPLISLIASVALVVAGTVSVGQAQQADDARIIASAISQLLPTISAKAARPDAVIVFDPTMVVGKYGEGLPDRARAGRVSAVSKVKVATLRESVTCTTGRACRLNADAAFRFGSPVIRGDTATVNVVIWFAANPEWRDPMPVEALALTLVRSGNQWNLIEKRLLMES
jgi:hypothetical protein